MKTNLVFVIAGLLLAQAEAQTILFDFENAAAHTPLPITVTVGGISAHLSGTGQGYSVQPANTMGFTPLGFSGNCIYPSSIYASDLLVSFSRTLTDFSILYAPQELACDSSATMRVTAFMDGALVGSATTNAAAGTWPSETLRFSSLQGFNSVVVHYDKPPVTGGDYGVIFMADNMAVTPGPPPLVLTGMRKLPTGAFQLDFSNTPNTAFTVLATTDPSLPRTGWTVLGPVTETTPGQYQFTDPQSVSIACRYYCIRSP